MRQLDMGIAYDSKLKEVRGNIQKLQEMALDMSEMSKRVDRIEQEIKDKVKGSYDSFATSEGKVFLSDSLMRDYQTATTKLEKINQSLKREWEVYYKINASKESLRDKMDHFEESKVEDIISSAKKLLMQLRESTTIDFEMERNLVQEVYELVYKAIQLELIYSKQSALLDYVKEDSVDIPHITELVRRDISQVEEEDSEELNRKLVELQKSGLDESILLDKSLLILLVLYKNSDLKLKSRDNFLRESEDLLRLRSKIDTKKKEQQRTQASIQKLTQKKKKYTRKGIGKRIVILVNSLLVAAGIAVGVAGSREIAKGKDYHTITTTYDSSTDDTTIEEDYIRGKDGSISLIEYSPWDTPGVFREDYQRNVYEYDLGDMEHVYTNLPDYLNPELKDKITLSETKTEKQKARPEDIGYSENKYVIKSTEKDLDDYQISDRPVLWILLSMAFSAGIISADFFLFRKLSKEKLRLIRENKKEIKEEIKEEREEQERLEKDLEKLVAEEENRARTVLMTYDTLPTAVQSLEEVEQASQKVRSR